VAELRPFGQVEVLSPKPQAGLLAGRKHPLWRHVHLVLARPAHNADAAFAELLIREACSIPSFGRRLKCGPMDRANGWHHSREQRAMLSTYIAGLALEPML
jgi:hypothetical protein